jgi:hypothetical protein
MAEHVIWWGFLLATACSVLHVYAIAEQGMRIRFTSLTGEAATLADSAADIDGNGSAAETSLRIGRDGSGPWPEEILATVFVKKGLMEPSELGEMLSAERDFYEGLVNGRDWH